ncbi:hypothetical protein CASFOL_036997 [Castilleja foliolosa]|uniref:C2H2-type domain-containing protein n=1 Tax=Castilleja foliolosa TaxID=1961234 RepID=A0ABD3BRT1_9LAMI
MSTIFRRGSYVYRQLSCAPTPLFCTASLFQTQSPRSMKPFTPTTFGSSLGGCRKFVTFLDRYVCNICSLHFRMAHRLRVHCEVCHSTEYSIAQDKNYICSCGCVFCDEMEYKDHLSTCCHIRHVNPPEGMVKVSIDGSCKWENEYGSGESGSGGLIRTHTGYVHIVFSDFLGLSTPLLAELDALERALSFIQQIRCKRVIIATDSEQAFFRCKKDNENTMSSDVVAEDPTIDFEFHHIFSTYNSSAHALAQIGYKTNTLLVSMFSDMEKPFQDIVLEENRIKDIVLEENRLWYLTQGRIKNVIGSKGNCGFEITLKFGSSHGALKKHSKCSDHLLDLSLDTIQSNLRKLNDVKGGNAKELNHETIAKGLLQIVILISEASKWSKPSKVLIRAKFCPDEIEEARSVIPGGLIFEEEYVTSVDQVKAIIRIVSNQSYDEFTKSKPKSKKPRR